MRARTYLALLLGSLVLVACTSDANLGDGADGGPAGGAGQAGAAGKGGNAGGGTGGSAVGGKGGTAGQSAIGGNAGTGGGPSTGGNAGTGGGPSTGGNAGTGGTGACTSGTADCDGKSANGCETYTDADPYNCGACAVVCTSPSYCAAGVCHGDADAGGCSNSQPCPAGQVCMGNVCVVNQDAGDCSNTQPCPAGMVCEGNVCVIDQDADAGGCSNSQPCPAGMVCLANVCVIDQDADAGSCSNTQQCPGGMVCVGNVCVVDQDAPSCLSGWADCDGNNTNGCETYLFGDPNNCGSCGTLCNTAESCDIGVCTVVADAAPPANCDPFTNAGCQTGWACVIGIPYYGPSDIYCRPAGSGPVDSACSPQALCQPGTECVFEDPYGNGHCRQFCDLTGGVHGCPGTEWCGNIYHPTIGICVP